MRIQPFTLGPYGTNSYIVYGYSGNECVIIDAPFPMERALDFIAGNSLSPRAVLLTHGHFDHVFGLGEIRSAYPSVPVYISRDDMDYLEDGSRKNLELLRLIDPFYLSRFVPDEISMPCDAVPYGETAGPFDVMATPGHTPGSVSLYSESEEVLFSGDTLFRGSAGRTDIWGDSNALLSSLRRLSSLPESVTVLPGHGGTTSIGKERRDNPFMRG